MPGMQKLHVKSVPGSQFFIQHCVSVFRITEDRMSHIGQMGTNLMRTSGQKLDLQKRLLPEKMFGIFPHRVTRPSNPLVRGFDEEFWAPHSRHTGIDEEQVKACKDLRVLAESDEAGIYLMSTDSGRQIFVTGHPEYERLTLDAEYRRDVAKGLPIAPPKHYYPGDDPSKEPVYRWRAHAFLLYTNWLNYYVYQNTPYDLGELDTF